VFLYFAILRNDLYDFRFLLMTHIFAIIISHRCLWLVFVERMMMTIFVVLQ
jgi:hypothetical protein